MTAPEVAFLCALSLLVVALAAFTVLVTLRATARAGVPGGRFADRHILRWLELHAGSVAAGTRWAAYLHRISGVGVLGFLMLHVVDVSLFAFSTRLYNQVHHLYSTPGLRVLECGLIFAVLFHTLNGLRILAVDGWSLGARAARLALIPVAALSVLAGVGASVAILAPVL